jgi:hypothetical protein
MTGGDAAPGSSKGGQMAEKESKGLDRRAFLRRAAATGIAAAWAAPVVQSIAATPAFAQQLGTPPVEEPFCGHSVGGQDGGGCMSACTASGCTGDACDGVDPDPNGLYNNQGPCQFFCPSGQGGDNPCCNRGLCDPANFVCHHGDPRGDVAEYTGSTAGCPSPD